MLTDETRFRPTRLHSSAWDQCKTRTHRCKPLEAKQRFRAAMAKMRLQILKAWGVHEPEKGFQIRRFPKADLDDLSIAVRDEAAVCTVLDVLDSYSRASGARPRAGTPSSFYAEAANTLSKLQRVDPDYDVVEVQLQEIY
ncbi:hypothetical protein HPB52_007072 [Rhipicephalus sanguineus]|uniref:Uncharacterized protein n=1 Tax=Rhipicephalus sanguineus TaxID=34632 RepID=A0A9D4PYK3_RHISA|nr:hypothetical protein HPB52_007072 [Rhipicephalus sanguineus]